MCVCLMYFEMLFFKLCSFMYCWYVLSFVYFVFWHMFDRELAKTCDCVCMCLYMLDRESVCVCAQNWSHVDERGDCECVLMC